MLNLKKLWGRLTKRGTEKADGKDAEAGAPEVRVVGKRVKRAVNTEIAKAGAWRLPKKPAWARRACINRRFWMRIQSRLPLELPAVSDRRALRGLRVWWPLKGRPKPSRLARLRKSGKGRFGRAA